MRSKLFIIALMLTTVGYFSYFVISSAVSTTRDLHKQSVHKQELIVQSEQLDKKLHQTTETKEQTKQEVQQLDQQTQATVSERQKLEAELLQLEGN